MRYTLCKSLCLYLLYICRVCTQVPSHACRNILDSRVPCLHIYASTFDSTELFQYNLRILYNLK